MWTVGRNQLPLFCFFKHLTWIKLWNTPLTPSFWNAPWWFRLLINYYPKLFTESLQQCCRRELLLSFVLKVAPWFKKLWVLIMLFMAALTSHDWCNWRSCSFILQKMWLTTVWAGIQHQCQALFLCWKKKSYTIYEYMREWFLLVRTDRTDQSRLEKLQSDSQSWTNHAALRGKRRSYSQCQWRASSIAPTGRIAGGHFWQTHDSFLPPQLQKVNKISLKMLRHLGSFFHLRLYFTWDEPFPRHCPNPHCKCRYQIWIAF